MNRSLKTLILTGLVLLVFSATAFGAGLTMEKKIGDLLVKVVFGAETIPVDTVGLSVSITDNNGAAVTDAKVRVYYGMAAMPGMPPMDYKTKAKLDGDVYRTKLDFSMAGPWYVTVKFKRPGDSGVSKAKFNVDAH